MTSLPGYRHTRDNHALVYLYHHKCVRIPLLYFNVFFEPFASISRMLNTTVFSLLNLNTIRKSAPISTLKIKFSHSRSSMKVFALTELVLDQFCARDLVKLPTCHTTNQNTLQRCHVIRPSQHMKAATVCLPIINKTSDRIVRIRRDLTLHCYK